MANGYNQNNSWDPKGNFKTARSKWAILVVAIVSIVLIGVGILLAYDTANGLGIVDSIFSSEQDLGKGLPTVTSISFDSEAIGMTANLNEVYVKMTYSDGSTRQVALSRFNPEGLDLTVEGQQNITITYGGTDWNINVNVVASPITIKYVTSDGGSIIGDTTQVLPAGQNGSTVEAIPQEGYEFVGWDDKVMTARRQETAVSADMEYRAIFARKTYRVRFKLADGTWYSVAVDYGDNVPVPSEGTYAYQKYGFKFGGWDIDKEKLNNIQADLDVYGIYNDYNADFMLYVTANSGVHKDGSGDYVGALGLKDLETSQYSHVNGSDNQTCEVSTTPSGSGIDRTALLYQGFYSFEDSSQIKVIANPGAVLSKWMVLTASGTWEEIAPDTKTKGIAVLSEGLDPVNFTSVVDGSTYTLSFSLNETTSDKVLQVIAVMEYQKNTISFEEASTIVGNVQLDYQQSLTLEAVANAIDPERATVSRDGLGNPIEYANTGLPVLEKYGYTFAGWYKQNSTTAVDDMTKFSEDTVVEARWDVNQFTVKFDDGLSDNLGSIAQAEKLKDIDYNSTIGTSFLAVMPERANYSFVGWFEEGHPNTAVTAATLVLRDMTLIPVFKPKEHSLSITVEGQVSLTERYDNVKDSVYRLEINSEDKVEGNTIIVNSNTYYIFPTATIISDDIGEFRDKVISLDSIGKAYYVTDDAAYSLAVLDSAAVHKNGADLDSIVLGGTTYYVRDAGNVAVNAGSYNVRNILSTGSNKYYILANTVYQLRDISATMTVDDVTNIMTSFELSDQVYYVDNTTGIVYQNREMTSLAGSYDSATGMINIDDVNYFADIDNKAIYQMSTTRAILTRDADDNLTKIQFANVAYDIEAGIAYENVGSLVDNILTLGEAIYYLDAAEAQLYTMATVTYQKATDTMIVDGNTYYVKGEDILSAVGTKDGDIYNIASSVYYAVGSMVYELKEQVAATLMFDESGIMTQVKFGDNAPVAIGGNYVDGILTEASIPYYIYRGSDAAVDTSKKTIYETNNYVYTFTWSENYQLAHLKVNGVDVKDDIVVTSGSAILVLRFDGDAPAIALDQDIAIDIALEVKQWNINITSIGDTQNDVVYGISGQEALTGSSSYVVAINTGETVELDITVPANLAIKSVTINGSLRDSNKSTFNDRFENLSEDKNIVVVYEAITFDVTLNDGDAAEDTSDVPYGEPYLIELEAEDGKYIEKIAFNGSIINIYDCQYEEIVLSSIEVNGKPATATQIENRDARITKLLLEVTSVTKNISIDVSYDTIFYWVYTEVVGNGVLTTDSAIKVGKNDTAAISIDYEIGYKIAKYTQEKIELVDGKYIENVTEYDTIRTRFDNIDCDIKLTYYVEAVKNTIVFNTDGLVSVAYNGETQSFDRAYQFAVDYNKDAEFIVTAPSSKYIASIVEGDKAYELPYMAQSFKVFKTQVIDTALIKISLADLSSATDNIIVEQAIGGYASAEIVGTDILLKVIPEHGYDIASFRIAKGQESPETFVKGDSAISVQYDALGNVYYEYTFALTSDTVVITPAFVKRDDYKVVLKIDDASQGFGGIYYGITQDAADLKVTNTEPDKDYMEDMAVYQQSYKVFFIAGEGSYIYEVKVDGVPISFEAFEEHTIKTTNHKYSVGSLTINVSRDTEIVATYMVDVFEVSIEAVGLNPNETDVWGIATVDKAEYLSGDDVSISMQASEGWHISSMSINNIEIDKSLFLKSLDIDLLKFNTTANFIYEGIDGAGITQNTTIFVYFEKNTYVLNYYAYNESINYKDIDTQYVHYGSATVTYNGGELSAQTISDGITDGGKTMYKSVYRGIKHGDSIAIALSSYTRNGYKVSSIGLKLSSGEQIIVIDNNITTSQYSYDKQDNILTINNVVEDIFSLEIHYTRRTADISAVFDGDSAAFGSDIGFEFKHPQKDSAPIITQNGEHDYTVEYGITYRLTMTPTISYEVVSCKANGQDQTYTNIQDGKIVYLDGSVDNDRDIAVNYSIKTFRIRLVVNAGEEELGIAGIYGETADTITVEYGTPLRVDLTPYTNKGGYIARFAVNGFSRVDALIESGDTYIYTQDQITELTDIEVVFEKQVFDVTYTQTADGGTVSLNYADNLNASWRGTVEWGDSVLVSIDLNEHYEIKYYTFEGDPTQYEIYEDMYVGNNKSQIVFTIEDIQKDTVLILQFTLKVFDATITVNNPNYGDVELYDDKDPIKDQTTMLNPGFASTASITCTKNVVVRIKPTAGRIISSVTFKMNTLRGTVSTLTLSGEEYDSLHTDWLAYTVQGVTGDLSIDVVYQDKLYSLSITLLGNEASTAFDTFNIRAGGVTRQLNNYTQSVTGLFYGTNIDLNLYLKNGYDIEYLTINQRNYFGSIGRANNDADRKKEEINNYIQSFILDDTLINNIYEGAVVSGSGTDFTIELIIAVARDTYKSIFDKQNITQIESTDTILTVNDNIDFIFATETMISASVKDGYAITKFYIEDVDTNAVLFDLLTQDDITKTYVDGQISAIIGFMSIDDIAMADFVLTSIEGNRYYEKNIHFVIEFKIKTYDQQVVEYVFDKETKATDAGIETTVSNTTAGYHYLKNNSGTISEERGTFNKQNVAATMAVAYDQVSTVNAMSLADFVNGDQLSVTSLQYGSTVTIESSLKDSSGIYRFYGFEEYVNGSWIAVADGVNGVTFDAAQKIRYIVYSVRTFRAIYERIYTVEIESLPFHKATQGTAPNISYVSYTGLTVSATDPFSGEAVFVDRRTTDNIAVDAYQVQFGASILVRGSDSFISGATANRTTSVTYFNSDRTSISTASETPPDVYSTVFTVDDDYDIVAVFKNNVQLVLSYASKGGETNESGGMVTVKNNSGQTLSKNGDNGYYAYKLPSAYEEVTITIAVNQYYRFDGFYSRVATNRDTKDKLVWSKDYDAIVTYKDIYIDNDNDYEVDSDTAEYKNGNYTITRSGDVITIKIFVTENCMYRIDYVKTFAIDTYFINDGTSIDKDTDTESTVSLDDSTVLLYTGGSSTSIALKSNGEMRYDYGSNLYMSLAGYSLLVAQPADWGAANADYYELRDRGFTKVVAGTAFEPNIYYSRAIDQAILDNTDEDNYQFIGWYLGYENDAQKMIDTNMFKLSSGSYYDAYKYDYNIVLDNSVIDIVDLADKNKLRITAEYLPIYDVAIVNGFNYMKDAEGVEFYYATSETSLATVVYESTDYDDVTGLKNETLSIRREVRDMTYVEWQKEYAKKSNIRMLTHIVDISNRGFSSNLNTITLKAVINASYQFNYWEISVDGGVTFTAIADSDAASTNKATNSTYVFDLVDYVTKNNIQTRELQFRPNLSKLNEVVVSKVVYYEKEGEMSYTSAALNAVSVYVASKDQMTASGLYGQTVDVVAMKNQENYRFIGWFDKTGKQVNDTSLEASYTEETATLRFIKSGADNYGSAEYYTDYTYELEARYIRTVEIKFSVVNASAAGREPYDKCAPYIYGVDASENQYIGTDKDGAEALRKVSSTSEHTKEQRLQTVTITQDAGTYAVLKLTTESDAVSGFDNTSMFRSGFAVGSSCYYNNEDGYYTLFFNYKRDITVQYVTYGKVMLDNALKNTKITLSKEIGDVYVEGIDIAYQNGIDMAQFGVNINNYELTDPAGKYTIKVREDTGALEITTTDVTSIILPYIKKTDYNNAQMQVALSQMRSGYILKDFLLKFSYREHSATDINIDLIESDYMPFAGGEGTSGAPYIIIKPVHLAAIEAIYKTSSNLADVASDPITINGITYVTYISNPSNYSVEDVYFAMDTELPQSERYMSLKNWQALCRDGDGFDSVFDGGGWELGNITATPTEDYYGIFGKSYGATFREVDFMGGNDIAADAEYIGLLVGYAIYTDFYDINVKANNEVFLGGHKTLGTIKTEKGYVGVLAGYMDDCVVENVYLRLATVVGNAKRQPVRDPETNIIKTDDYGNIIYETVDGYNVGGIAGYAANTRIGSSTTSIVLDNVTIQGGSYIGGIVGEYISTHGLIYEITNISFRGNSSSFGVSNESTESFNVGGIAGYMGEDTKLSNIVISTSGINLSIYGYYRPITREIVQNMTEEYVENSAIGGFVGTSKGEIDNIQLTQGVISIQGSIAGGFVGANFGTVRNVYIGRSGKVLFNLQYGGYYGGMIGFNGRTGFVNYARIGTVNEFSGLASNADEVMAINSNIDGGANVLFLSDGKSDVDGETYNNQSGPIHSTWGFNAMGGVIGLNSGILYNSVTYGKVVAYKRIMSGVTAYDALGGLVGVNFSSELKGDTMTDTIQVISCGSSFGVVINYSVLVNSGQTAVVNYAAVGGSIGHHGLGIARGLFSYHTVVANVYNVGVPSNTEAGVSATSIGSTAGIASSLANLGFGVFETSWAYYNTTTFNTGSSSMFNVKLGDGQCTETKQYSAVAYNSTTGGNPESDGGWLRANILPTNANYYTEVGATSGCVSHTQGKAFSAVASLINSCTEGNAKEVPINTLFDSGAYMYARNSDGSQGRIAPNQYNSSPNKTSDWMLG